MTVAELKDIARNNNFKNWSKLKKADLIQFLIDNGVHCKPRTPVCKPRTPSPVCRPRTPSPVCRPRSPVCRPRTPVRRPRTPVRRPRTRSPVCRPRTPSPVCRPRTPSPVRRPRTPSPVCRPRTPVRRPRTPSPGPSFVTNVSPSIFGVAKLKKRQCDKNLRADVVTAAEDYGIAITKVGGKKKTIKELCAEIEERIRQQVPTSLNTTITGTSPPRSRTHSPIRNVVGMARPPTPPILDTIREGIVPRAVVYALTNIDRDMAKNELLDTKRKLVSKDNMVRYAAELGIRGKSLTKPVLLDRIIASMLAQNMPAMAQAIESESSAITDEISAHVSRSVQISGERRPSKEEIQSVVEQRISTGESVNPVVVAGEIIAEKQSVDIDSIRPPPISIPPPPSSSRSSDQSSRSSSNDDSSSYDQSWRPSSSRSLSDQSSSRSLSDQSSRPSALSSRSSDQSSRSSSSRSSALSSQPSALSSRSSSSRSSALSSQPSALSSRSSSSRSSALSSQPSALSSRSSSSRSSDQSSSSRSSALSSQLSALSSRSSSSRSSDQSSRSSSVQPSRPSSRTMQPSASIRSDDDHSSSRSWVTDSSSSSSMSNETMSDVENSVSVARRISSKVADDIINEVESKTNSSSIKKTINEVIEEQGINLDVDPERLEVIVSDERAREAVEDAVNRATNEGLISEDEGDEILQPLKEIIPGPSGLPTRSRIRGPPPPVSKPRTLTPVKRQIRGEEDIEMLLREIQKPEDSISNMAAIRYRVFDSFGLIN
jgi:hypothetical protein